MEKEIMKAGTRANVSLYPDLVICQILTSGEDTDVLDPGGAKNT
jgi:hypothetical protein